MVAWIGPAIGAAASVAGGIADKIMGDKSAKQSWKQQKQVLQNQVQWRVQDSVKAGLHPLAALGMAPAAVGGTTVGTDFQSMGQDIGRAVEAAANPSDQLNSAVMRLQIERGGLENELLKTQIASQRMRNMQQGTPGISGNANPPVTIPMGPNMPGWKVTDATAGQRAENAYQEWGNLLILPQFMHDASKYLGLERMLSTPTPAEYGHAAGTALREWFLKDAKGNTYK